MSREKSQPVFNAQAALYDYAQNALLFRREMVNKLVDPRRNIDKECGYPDVIEPELYQQFWERHAVARRVVKMDPNETWKQPPSVYETEDEEETEFERAWEDLVKRLNVWEVLKRADVISGIQTYGVLLIGTSDGKDLHVPLSMIEVDFSGQNRESEEETIQPRSRKLANGRMKKPAPRSAAKPITKNAEEVKNRTVTFLKCYDESLAKITKYEEQQTSPRFGMPVEYEIKFANPRQSGFSTAITQAITARVHWTRIIHLADNRTTSDIFGTPRQQEVFNDLYDWKKIRGGSAEMFWKGGFPGYAFEMMPETMAAMNAGQDVGIDKEGMAKEMEMFANSLSRYMTAVGVSVKSLEPQVADPSKHLEAILTSIAIAKEIPLRQLMGSEQGQLASGQDSRNRKEYIKSRQDTYASPSIVRAFVDRLIAIGCLPMPVEYFVEWPDLFAPGQDEIATVAQKLTQALAAYVAGNVEAVYPLKQYLMNVFKMSQEEVDAIIKEAETAERMTEDPNDLEREQMELDAQQRESDRQLAAKTQDKDLKFRDKDSQRSLQAKKAAGKPRPDKKPKAK